MSLRYNDLSDYVLIDEIKYFIPVRTLAGAIEIHVRAYANKRLADEIKKKMKEKKKIH
jgi:hypothetical protein